MFNKNLTFIGLFATILLNTVSCQFPNFHLYTKVKPTYSVVTTANLLANGFSHAKQTKILIHGFSDSGLRTSLLAVKNEILKKEDVNVIVVDWEQGALAPDYFKATDNVKIVGPKVADFIKNANINAANVHCIGHSLGAHACGFASKVIKLKRISGLDPAGPFFRYQPANVRLDKTDATFVDNIHTDMILGIQDPVGHKDYYPNSGKSQPGCILGKDADAQVIQMRFSEKGDITSFVSCSHSRVVNLYAESVNSICQFKSAQCNSWDDYNNGVCKCTTPTCSAMGYNANNTYLGKFYLKTNDKSAFCLA